MLGEISLMFSISIIGKLQGTNTFIFSLFFIGSGHQSHHPLQEVETHLHQGVQETVTEAQDQPVKANVLINRKITIPICHFICLQCFLRTVDIIMIKNIY